VDNLNKGVTKAEVTLKWDPSPLGESDHDLDIIAATYTSGEPGAKPVYLVHFGSRSPDGTITLNRDSRTGQGFGIDEDMVLELTRLGDAFRRVVVGVAIQQRERPRTFGDIVNPSIRVLEGYQELCHYDFADVADCTAATVAEFTRDPLGSWQFRPAVQGFDTDPQTFGRLMSGGSPA